MWPMPGVANSTMKCPTLRERDPPISRNVVAGTVAAGMARASLAPRRLTPPCRNPLQRSYQLSKPTCQPLAGGLTFRREIGPVVQHVRTGQMIVHGFGGAARIAGLNGCQDFVVFVERELLAA